MAKDLKKEREILESFISEFNHKRGTDVALLSIVTAYRESDPKLDHFRVTVSTKRPDWLPLLVRDWEEHPFGFAQDKDWKVTFEVYKPTPSAQ